MMMKMKGNLSRLTALLTAMAMVAVAGLTACTSAPEPAPLPPTVTINSPMDGVELPAGDITVSINVSNFNIVQKLGQSAGSGEGHIHYYLDAEPPTTPGQPAVSGPGTYAATTETSHTWENVEPGTHTFSVQLVNNNHTPLEPPVIAKVTVNVEAPVPSPTLKILSLAPGAALPVGVVTVTVEVTDFSIVSKLGQPNATGEGHIHYYLDAEPPTTPGQPAVSGPGTYAATTETSHTWENVEPGTHTFSVQLVNNNHTPLEPPVIATVSVTVTQPVTITPSAQPVTINLSARNTAFNISRITVPPGAMLTIVFTNNDSGIHHNFAVYDTSAASTPIFVGEIITGVRTIEYTFMTPTTPGTYFFRCDVHPTIMKGEFVVREGGVSTEGNSGGSSDGSGSYSY